MKTTAIFSNTRIYNSKRYMNNFIRIRSCFFVLLFFSFGAIKAVYAKGDHIKLASNHPDSYTVVKGDTLWDISGKFLHYPWQWPEIWEINPQIKNPHLIYPGDELVLTYVEGQPRIRRVGSGPRPTYKLSPTKRIEELNLAIPTIELEKITPFLTGNTIVRKNNLNKAPYIVGTSEDHLIAASGYEVYANNIPIEDNNFRFGIYYMGKSYINPDKPREILGYEAIYLGEAELIRKGSPATLRVTKSRAEIINGSRLLALNDTEINSNFIPKAAQTKRIGRILGSLTSGLQAAVNNISATDVVLINFGDRDGIEVGDVFNVFRKGNIVSDPLVKTSKVKLPDEFAGNMLVFKTFKKISYAIIMDANQIIKVGDLAVSPYMVQE